MIEAQRATYREEAFELLAELESSLLALEETPQDQEIIGRVFRALHTIKGSGAMFGFDAIAGFTHEVETVFDLVRDGRMAVTKALVDLTLAAKDRIRSMLAESPDTMAVDGDECRRIVQALHELAPQPDTGSVAVVSPQKPPSLGSCEKAVTYRIHFRPHRNIYSTGTRPILLLNELRELGDCNVIAHTDTIPPLEDLNPEECFLYWDILLTTKEGINAIRDVFIFVEDDCDLKIEPVDEEEGADECGSDKLLGEILVQRGYISREDIEQALRSRKRIGEVLMDGGLVDAARIEAALVEQQHFREIRRKQQRVEQASTIRIPADRLDTLVDLVGEMVTVQARLSETVASLDHAELLSISEEVERLTGELRDNTMSLRMLPIGTAFNKLKRLVRDLSDELGKEVVLITEGAETELDKTVIERLNDPLVHLMRNCIDHGIEKPEAREREGKPREGTVRVSAAHSGASVMIRISDDGAGLNADAIRARAVEKKLISPGAEMPEKEVFSLIFTPGFSTAENITSISGRGVGMDVVKRSIEVLRGSIEVGSQRGAGTTITMKLPLTLAIIDGLLVKVGEGFFVIPLSVVRECVELTPEDVARAHGRQITVVRGEIVPYIRLRERFAINGEVPEVEQIVITEVPDGSVGLVVDKVMGGHQTVIKNLGKLYRNVEGISGATILGDGTVALIMDIHKLVQEIEAEERKEHSLN